MSCSVKQWKNFICISAKKSNAKNENSKCQQLLYVNIDCKFACSKSVTKTLEKGIKNVQS